MAQAAVATPPQPELDHYAQVRKSSLDLAKEQYRQVFRMRAKEFIRGKGSLAVVNEPICMGCTHCFDNCAFEAIDMADRKFTLPDLTYTSRKAVIITENCVGCEKCALVCPVDAITMVPKEGWEVRDGRLTQIEKPPTAERPFFQPPKPGEPRPPVEAKKFVAFREEAKKVPAPPRKPAPAPAPEAPPKPTPPKPVAPEAPKGAPPTAPTPPAAKPAKSLSPEDVRRLREEARKRAEAAKKAQEGE